MKPYAIKPIALAILLALPVLVADAATTDLGTEPLANTSAATAKPNIMFTLDDSGSMAWSYAPDTTYNFQDYDYGAVSSQCNAMYYNPSITYTPPKNADGTSYPDASFNAAWKNGYDTSAGTVDLYSGYYPYDATSSYNDDDTDDGIYYSVYNGISGKQAFYYKYTGSQVATGANYSNTNSTFYKECNSGIGGTPGKNVFTLVKIGSSACTSAECVNFANWYSYYRTRILLMKTGVGTTFSGLDSGVRVGFNTINYTGYDSANSKFLNIADFDSTQKDSWFDKLYAVTPSGSTPLRAAESKVGRIFAGTTGSSFVSGTNDPVKYSCQRNYHILSTDGYWNTGSESSSYKPIDKDGATLGNQDYLATVTRPSYDPDTTQVTGASDDYAPKTSLADVAYYYYQTDLRSGTFNGVNWDNNNVPANGTNSNVDDVASHQHMTTFTVGLGVDGTLTYRSDYKTATSGSYYNILTGASNWPAVTEGGATTVDDLWHAAVNGRGTYYSAKNPESLSSGLLAALTSIQKATGSAAAAATSSLNPVSGDNFAYVASYTTVEWWGDIKSYTIDTSTGALSSTPNWAAATLLDSKTSLTSSASRTIYKADSVTGSIESFTWANLDSTEKAYFTDAVTTGGSYNLTQLSSWTTGQTTLVNGSGETLVEYLRGYRGYEDTGSDRDGDGDYDTNDTNRQLYRARVHILGDIVHTQPVHVGAPPFFYTDGGYITGSNGQENSGFKSTNSGRTKVVYAGANDGMLHAFNADTGVELWAYVPPQALPNMWRLADSAYASNHRYFVDGPIAVGDVCVSNCGTSSASWKTILVGGFGAGARGYYALDVTDPTTPETLWAFDTSDDADIGYSYGNPVITKRSSDGKWVVLLSTGYNNVSPGDGLGKLMMLDAATGSLLPEITTGAGSTATPAGLGKLSNWVADIDSDNTTQYVYGGDLLGNMWRFDLSDGSVMRLASFVDGSTPQPITVRPELLEITVSGSAKRVLLFGTGRYLGTTDLADTSQQSFYGVLDDDSDWGNLRTGSELVEKTMATADVNSDGVLDRTMTDSDVDWATKAGWYLDLPDSGERVGVDPVLSSGTIVYSSVVPTNDACDAGGYSWYYYQDAASGNSPSSATLNMVGQKITGAVVVGINVVTLPDGRRVAIVTKSDGSTESRDVPLSTGSTAGTKRVSWRELVDVE